jgi:NAD(P)-dependent dehydrogenase (short-subunit alcohol dehydrogenase family)
MTGPVLITGCSTGIGRATALRLAKKGHDVYATARKLDSIADLESRGCKLLALDVTDEESMKSAVDTVVEREGGIGALVNNAGYSQSGAIETVELDAVRKQFETNVFGLIRMCQLVLPSMRERGGGRIVNMSSMGANLVFPGGGIYHATKFAVEAVSDALRWEVKGFGVEVVSIQPGLIKTEFGSAATSSLGAHATGGPYDRFNRAVGKITAGAYDNKLMIGLVGGGPDRVARAVEKALTTRLPRRIYRVTPSARLMIAQRRLFGAHAWDTMVGLQYPRPGSNGS